MKSNSSNPNAKCPCGSGKKYKKCCRAEALVPDGNPFINSLEIHNFRCFDRFAVPELRRINLISGLNSVGKSTCLEALFLLTGAANLNLILTISQFRGIADLKGEIGSVLDILWAPLFHNFDTGKAITISGETSLFGKHSVEIAIGRSGVKSKGGKYALEGGFTLPERIGPSHVLTQTVHNRAGKTVYTMSFEEGALRISPTPSGPVTPGYFMSTRRSFNDEEAAYLFGKLKKNKSVDRLDIVEVLKIIEPRLVQLDTIPVAGKSLIFGDIGLDQLLPVSLMGEGLERILSVLLRIASASGGVVLIDEIENGLHHSIQKQFWQCVDRASEIFKTQIIATTHSYECIRNAFDAMAEKKSEDFLYHRLERVNNSISTTTYDTPSLESAMANDFEVR